MVDRVFFVMLEKALLIYLSARYQAKQEDGED